MMKFLANENLPATSIRLLRDNGVYVKSIREEFPGISDRKVIDIAQRENLIILTLDKDYGELIFKYTIGSPPAIIFFRYKGNSPSFAGTFLIKLLEDKSISLSGNFTVVEENSLRQRKY